MKIHIEFKTPTNGCKAVNIINRLTHDLDGKRLKPGQRFLLVDDGAAAVGMATVSAEPATVAEHAAAVMEPVIAGTRKRGSIARLQRTFHARTGDNPNASTWFRWLNSDPAQRMEPSVGTALAIRAAFDQMEREDAAAEVKQQAAATKL